MGSSSSLASWKDLLKAQSNLWDVHLTLPPMPCCVLDVIFIDEEVPATSVIQNGCAFPSCVSDLFQAPVTETCYMTSGDDVRKVISIVLDTKNSEVKFAAGDTIAILPCNCDCRIEEFASFLNVKNMLFKKCIINRLEQNSKKKPPLKHIPCCSTLYHILKTCVDIKTTPKKVLLRVLSQYTSDDHEKRCLEELCSKEGSSLYNSLVLETGITVQDILSVFPSCQPPVGRLLEFLPRLMPRPYSIASSPLVSPNSVHVVLSVVEYPVKGLCSGWLLELVKPLLEPSTFLVEKQMENLSLKSEKSSIEVPILFRKSTNFNLPDDLSVPLILIGPGTGIAPFIGFLQHRAAQKKTMCDVTFGEIWLFYGCRYANRDFLFRCDIEQYVKDGVISRLFVSYSRDTCHKNEVKYVQDNIKKNSKSFAHKILEDEGMIYICGDGKNMAKDVWKAIVQVISSETNLSESDADSYLLSMVKKGKYKQDIWV